MKKNISKILITALAISSMLSLTVIANSFNTNNKVDVEKTEQNELAEIQEISEESESQYKIEKGKVTSITIENNEEGEFAQIEVENENMGIVFTALTSTPVFDVKDGNLKTVKEITEGMEISGILPSMSIMTMSIPPMTPSAIGFVINSENSNIMVSKFNDDFVSSDNSLQLNINETTSILSFNGTKEILTQENIKNNEAIVIYDITTRSIPAQTTPSNIILIPSQEDEINDNEVLIDSDNHIYLPLRKTIEEKGFKLNWISNEEPVILQKDNTKIEIKLNEKEFKINDEEKEFLLPVTIEDGTMSISSEILKYLK